MVKPSSSDAFSLLPSIIFSTLFNTRFFFFLIALYLFQMNCWKSFKGIITTHRIFFFNCTVSILDELLKIIQGHYHNCFLGPSIFHLFISKHMGKRCTFLGSQAFTKPIFWNPLLVLFYYRKYTGKILTWVGESIFLVVFNFWHLMSIIFVQMSKIFYFILSFV